MMEVILNPPGVESAYLNGLNTCFEHWGDLAMYRWCFERQVGNLHADLMILQNEGNIVAGSAVTYRPVVLANVKLNVGIMTGSWTLPQARGHGCFMRIIEESVRLARGKGAALLLAFVTETNASFRRLQAAGSALFPTHYIFSDDKTPMPKFGSPISPVANEKQGVEKMLARLNQYNVGTAHFTYTADECRAQFLERPGEIEFLQIGAAGLAIVEKKGDFDRVLMLVLNDGMDFAVCVQSLLKRAMTHRRKLFLFTTSPAWQEACMKLGMGHAPGYLTALVANKNALKPINPSGSHVPDKVGDQFYEPTSPWFIGHWDIQSGDRM